MVIFLKTSSLENSQPRNRLSNLSMINVVEKFREILNERKQTTGDDKHLEFIIRIKLKRFKIVLVKLNWPQGKR